MIFSRLPVEMAVWPLAQKAARWKRKMRKGSGFGVQTGFFLNHYNLNPGFSD